MTEWQEILESSERMYWGLLGCRLVESHHEYIKIALTATERHLNHMHIVHGGVMMSMMDQAMGMMSMAVQGGQPCVTTNMNTHFVQSMGEGELYAIARVIHQSGRTMTLQAEITNEAGETGAIATATFIATRSK
ncbi:PaaI family thioesterase [Paenibacillus hunanensis]|uniref:PaaI family thioesterase n=1 Tax=Paenibacillus hunanensis TaxID=539262 RepID=UPI002025C89F|nr:PaaI family thioesterase [Paenibacillus hunanensis]MCL9660116.1 PaaI family thioesterase [Paenibacillus hunanensis]